MGDDESPVISNALQSKWTRDIKLSIDEFMVRVAREQQKHFEPVKSMCLEIISKNKNVVFGGTALNEILPDNLKFYCMTCEATEDAMTVPDIDMLSSTPLQDSEEIVKMLCERNVPLVECREGMHEGSYVVKALGKKIIDVVHCSEHIIERIRKMYSREILVKNLPIRIIDLTLMQYMFYAEFINPIQQPYRWVKMFPRYVSLMNAFPVDVKPTGRLGDHFEVLNAINPFETEAVFAVWRAVVRLNRPLIGLWAAILLKQSIVKKADKDSEELHIGGGDKVGGHKVGGDKVGGDKVGGAPRKLKTKAATLDLEDLDKSELEKLIFPQIPDINVHELEDKFLVRIGPEFSAIPVIEFLSETPDLDARYIGGIIGRILDQDVLHQHPMLIVKNFDEVTAVAQDSVENAFVEFRKTKIYVNDRLLVSIVHANKCMGFNQVKGKMIGTVDTILSNLYNTMLFDFDMSISDKSAIRYLIGMVHEMYFDEKKTTRNRLFRRFNVDCFGPLPESFLTLLIDKSSKMQMRPIRCPKNDGGPAKSQDHFKHNKHNKNKNKHQQRVAS
jgi:hypothetical protein